MIICRSVWEVRTLKESGKEKVYEKQEGQNERYFCPKLSIFIYVSNPNVSSFLLDFELSQGDC